MDRDTRKPHYTTVDLSDDAEGSELMSGTEVDSLSDDAEKAWTQRQHRRASPRKPTILTLLRESRFFIDTVLLLIIIGLLLMLYYQPASSYSSKRQIGGDYTGGGPLFTQKVVKWESDERFVPENATEYMSEETLQTWNGIMPSEAGRPKRLENNTFFTTTMTHELHCLFMMGKIFHGITTNNYTNIPKDYHSHFMHCIDYLRQGVMCAGDLAMEGHDEKDSDDFGPLDGGWNAHHVCKDYGEVLGYLDEQIKDGVRIVLAIDD